MNYSNITADTHFLCGTTSASYPLADITRNVNIEYDNVARLIWESDNTWNFDDSNNTDLPIAFRTVANASATYLIPTTALRVEQVEIKDGGGNWQKLRPITYGDLSISPEEYLTGGGTPIYYLLDGTQISLYPAPRTGDVTMSSGMAVRLSRNVTQFPTSATTTEPGYARPFHRLLSYGASLDFIQDNQQRQYLLAQKARLENGLVKFYQKRGAELKTTVKPAGKRTWRAYI